MPEKPQLAIDVIDTGIGISPEGLGKIFNPFVQADSSVTRRFGGTGLGLTISRRFAAALGGELTVASELGQGSTFTVTLDTGPLDGIRLLDAPQAQTSAARSGSRSAKDLPKLPPARVLVADDGEANRQLITVILTRAGVHVENAENGEVAVRMATSQPFDLILMDMQMPVMDGYTATTQAASTRTVDSDRGPHRQRHERDGGQMRRRRLLGLSSPSPSISTN